MTAKTTIFPPPAARLQHAHAGMLRHYARLSNYMLTVTFQENAMGEQRAGQMPNEEQVHTQLRYLSWTLNSAVWHNKTKFDDNCKILFVPVVEGANSAKRIHAHILLGNVKAKQIVVDHMQKYIPRSRCLAGRYDLTDIYDADGIAWYLTKEIPFWNEDAVAWQLASIPPQFEPS